MSNDILKIAFITTLDRNPGDAFIRTGIEYLLRQLIPFYKSLLIDKHDIRTLDTNWCYIQRHPRSLQKLLKYYFSLRKDNNDILEIADIIVQSGTPFYYIVPKNDSYQNYDTSTTTEWIREIWIRRILEKQIKTPILNLAVGTCQPFHSDNSEFYYSKELINFITETVRCAKLTVVRDLVGKSLLRSLNLPEYCLPCSSIFAPDFHGIFPGEPVFVLMNYMVGGGHYNLCQKIDNSRWQNLFMKIYYQLIRKYKVILVCHSPNEVTIIRKILPSAETYFSNTYEDYLNLYARARFGIFNRVHAGMVLAGFARPSIIVGNDTRARMAELMELPVYFVNDIDQTMIEDNISSFEEESHRWQRRLFELKEKTRKDYIQLIKEAIPSIINEDALKQYGRRTDFSSYQNDY